MFKTTIGNYSIEIHKHTGINKLFAHKGIVVFGYNISMVKYESLSDLFNNEV